MSGGGGTSGTGIGTGTVYGSPGTGSAGTGGTQGPGTGTIFGTGTGTQSQQSGGGGGGGGGGGQQSGGGSKGGGGQRPPQIRFPRRRRKVPYGGGTAFASPTGTGFTYGANAIARQAGTPAYSNYGTAQSSVGGLSPPILIAGAVIVGLFLVARR